MEALSLNPILFTQVPALDSVNAKLLSFIDAAPSWPPSSAQSQPQIKQTLTQAILPYLKSKFPGPNAKVPASSKAQASPGLLVPWARLTATLTDILSPAELFPLVDMWRLALLDPIVSSWCASLPLSKSSPDPIALFLTKTTSALAASNAPRNFILIVLRMLSNGFSNASLTRVLLSNSARTEVTSLLVATLLHEDAAVRTAAASLAFNVAAYLQKGRVDKVKGGAGIDEDGDWEVEMTSAVMEALDREKGSEEVGKPCPCYFKCFTLLNAIYFNSAPADRLLSFPAPPFTVLRRSTDAFARGVAVSDHPQVQAQQRGLW